MSFDYIADARFVPFSTWADSFLARFRSNHGHDVGLGISRATGGRFWSDYCTNGALFPRSGMFGLVFLYMAEPLADVRVEIGGEVLV